MKSVSVVLGNLSMHFMITFLRGMDQTGTNKWLNLHRICDSSAINWEWYTTWQWWQHSYSVCCIWSWTWCWLWDTINYVNLTAGEILGFVDLVLPDESVSMVGAWAIIVIPQYNMMLSMTSREMLTNQRFLMNSRHSCMLLLIIWMVTYYSRLGPDQDVPFALILWCVAKIVYLS